MQWIGYLAAALVFCTFAMRTMVPLRVVAIASNFAFIGWAVPLHLWPVVILHGCMLPMNLLRLRQIYRMLAALRVATARDIDVAPLLAHLQQLAQVEGTTLFRKGDPADCAYYIVSGEVAFPERDVRLGPGHFFGEVGVFASRGVRTSSAVCVTDAMFYRICQRDLVAAFYRSPPLAIALVRLIADRMTDNLARADEALVQSRLPSAVGTAD